MKEKCPKCGKNSIVYEDHSSVGGNKRYWSCTSCGEEMIMFFPRNQKKKTINQEAKMKTYYEIIQKCELIDVGESLDKHKYNIEQVFKIIEEAKKEVFDIIKTYQNPYPKDIFLWDNTGKIDFSRGRFNKHCYKIVESVRNNLLKDIEEKH